MCLLPTTACCQLAANPLPGATCFAACRDELLSYDPYDEGTFCRSRFWLLMAYGVCLGAIAGSVLVMLHRGGDVSSILQVSGIAMYTGCLGQSGGRSSMAGKLESRSVAEHKGGLGASVLGCPRSPAFTPNHFTFPDNTPHARCRASLGQRWCSSRADQRARAALATTLSSVVRPAPGGLLPICCISLQPYLPILRQHCFLFVPSLLCASDILRIAV